MIQDTGKKAHEDWNLILTSAYIDYFKVITISLSAKISP